jgi:hypothetical protein
MAAAALNRHTRTQSQHVQWRYDVTGTLLVLVALVWVTIESHPL